MIRLKFFSMLLYLLLVNVVSFAQQPCPGTLHIYFKPWIFICPGQSIEVGAYAWNVPLPLRWSTGETGPSIMVTEPGFYIVSDAAYCHSDTLAVMPFNDGAFSTVDTVYICNFQTTGLVQPSLIFGGYSVWNDGILCGSHAADHYGQYWVEMHFPCGVLTQHYEVMPAASGVVDMPVLNFCQGDSIVLTCPETTIHDNTFHWNTGEKSRSIIVTEPGEYTASFWVPCYRQFRFVVQPGPDCEACVPVMPNVFTPNNDGVDDNFFPRSGCEPVGWELTVFDRWGETVYSGKNWRAGWDGTQNGTPVPASVYFYLAQYIDRGKTKTVDGSVTLLR